LGLDAAIQIDTKGPASRPRPALCPHCGYDQAGVVLSWKESCPLRGVCAECGRVIEYGPLLGAKAYPPRWSFEHGQRPGIARFMATSVLCFRPRRLWGELMPEHGVRPWRLVIFAAMWLWLGYVADVLVATGVLLTGQGPRMGLSLSREILNTLRPYRMMWVPTGTNSWSGVTGRPLTGLTLLPVVLLALLAARLNRSQHNVFPVSGAHIWRALVYSLPLAISLYFVLLGATIGMEMAVQLQESVLDRAVFMLYCFVMLSAPALLAWWWTVFASEHMRLPETGGPGGWAVRGTMMMRLIAIMGGVVGMVVLLALFGR
jgi:hypothetical protein